MLRNFRKELENARREATKVMGETMPSKEFGTSLILAVIHLGLIESRIVKTTNLEERRTKINEFNRAKNAIEKGIRLLQNSKPRRRLPHQDQRKYLP